jgi:hypothetical protein
MRTTPMEGWQNIVLKGVSGGTRRRFGRMLEAEGILK